MELVAIVFIVVVCVREYMFYLASQEWMEERRELLNRIKPETAQLPNIETTEIVEPIRNDEDYWNAHEDSLKNVGTFPYGFDEEVRGR